VVYLFSQRKVKETTLYLDPGKVSSETKKLEEVQATSQSQQILEICFSETLDFDGLCKAGFPDTLREQKELSRQRDTCCLFLNKLMHLLMMR
jgi:hypothetical protein